MSLRPMQVEPSTKPEQALALRRMKRVATGALVASASIFVGLEIAGAAGPWGSAVKAAAEAATIGGLADWFAVTALFRRPLGLPIPHTGIIPASKDRIGVTLGRFIEENFVDAQALTKALIGIGFPEKIASWLEREADNPDAAKGFSVMVAAALAEACDGTLVEAAKQELCRLAGRSPDAEAVRRALLTGLAEQAKRRIVQDGEKITKALHAHIRRQIPTVEIGPLIVNTRRFAPRDMTGFLANQLYRQLLDAVSAAADDLADRRSRLSRELDVVLEEMASELVLDGNGPDGTFAEAWPVLRSRLADRLSAFGPEMLRLISDKLADALRNDTGFRDWIDGQVADIVRAAVADHKHLIAEHVARVVRNWTPESMAATVERHVGRDLQFIRLNGTVVGGLAGLAIHFLVLAIAGG